MIAEVAVPVPVGEGFHYTVPEDLVERLRVGHAVSVSFGRRQMTGYVLSLGAEAPEGRKLKAIDGLAQADVLFPASLVPLFRWASRYYCHPLGDVVRTALPSATRSASRAVVRLLPAGQEALAASRAGPAEALLRRLVASPAGAVSRGGLKRELGDIDGSLRKAEAASWVEVGQEEGAAAAKVRVEEVFALARTARAIRTSFPRVGPVRDRLIDYLDRFGPIPAGQLREAFPTGAGPLRQLREAGALVVSERQVTLRAADAAAIRDADRVVHPPTADQEAALAVLLPAVRQKSFSPFLLQGVTGSGKTEVYLRLASEVLSDGGSAVLLVPEIGLTPQFLARFRARFGEDVVGALHSGLTRRERYDEWLRIVRGQARLVIGPRSAVFAPVEGLRLVVVDEEHDTSYKQDDGLRYHARDMALVRAQKAGAVVVLGSATPSLESVRNAQEGRFSLLLLPRRVADRPLPRVEIVDLRQYPVEDPDAPGASLSPPLRAALEDNLAAQGQTILLLNRRGFATTVLCTACGLHLRCPDCDVSKTYHGRRHQVLCHWCGAADRLPKSCPACGDPQALKLVGRGTERLEEEMLALWPELRIDRMDADTTTSKGAHRRILDRFREGEVDVLVGTQMVAKGHDFPRVTLVGALHADAALHLPDFRASERTFQLVAQVAGRAGRGDRPGKVLVQSYHPGHHAIRLALEHDFDGFAERELRFRKGLWYPPYARLVLFRVSATNEAKGSEAARKARQSVEEASRGLVTGPGQLRVLGPAAAPMYRVRGRFRWQVLVKGAHPGLVGALLDNAGTKLVAEIKAMGGGCRLAIDRDPQSLM